MMVFLNVINLPRHSVSFKGITDLNKVFSIETGVNYSFSKAQNAANQGGWNWGGNAAMMSTYYTPRNLDLKNTYDCIAIRLLMQWKQLRRGVPSEGICTIEI